MAKQRRSGHRRFKASVKKVLIATLEKAGFLEGECLFWKRDRWGNIHGIDFQMGRNEWTVNVGFHFGFLPGLLSWSQDPSEFGLLDFCLNWRPSGIGRNERWVPVRESTEETVVGEAQAAIESLDSYTVKWADPTELLTAITPDDLQSDNPYPCPSAWGLWRHVSRSSMAFALATLARQQGKQGLARSYVIPVLERIPYSYFKKKAEDVLGERL